MVEILEADDVHGQVSQLFQQTPELGVVSHQRNETRMPVLRRHNFDVLNETGQQPTAFAPDDDPISPGMPTGLIIEAPTPLQG